MNWLMYNRIGILTLVFFIGACSDKDENSKQPSLPEGDIVPLATGNQWVFNTYNTQAYTFQGTITMDIEEQLSNNRYLYGWTVDLTNGNYTYNQGACQLKEDGYYEGSLTSLHLLYKYPAKKGDEFFYTAISKHIVSSVYEVITVPAGTFECIRYDTYWSDYEGKWTFDCYTWVSPGVGQIAESKELDGHYYRQLVTYKIL